MPLSEKRTFSFDDPVFQKALELAEAFADHCNINNLPDDFMINGVHRNAYKSIEKAYIEGKKYEKERIATLLGLNSF